MNKTLKDIAEFLKSLPDDEDINMSSGANEGCGCLLTKYLRNQGIQFNYVFSKGSYYTDGESEYCDLSFGHCDIFDLFFTPRKEGDNTKVKYWKDNLRPEYQ